MENNINDITFDDNNNEDIAVKMLPLSMLFKTLPRAVHSLIESKSKQIDWEITGEDTCIDENVIVEIKALLIHLLNNAIEHGIESPEQRENLGKKPSGKISINAHRQGQSVIIEIADDGQGIDLEKIKTLALEQDLISEKQLEDITEKQLFKHIFKPSSRPITTETGEEPGFDFIKNKIHQLKGKITVFTESNKGSKFVIKLPLILSMMKCLLINVSKEIFALPIDVIAETIRVSPDEVNVVGNKEAVNIQGKIVPLVRLENIFQLSTKTLTEKRFLSLVVVKSSIGKIALLVDKLMGRQAVYHKPLGYPLTHVKHISDGAILSNGQVILILDIPSITTSLEDKTYTNQTTELAQGDKRHKTILLAEDTLSTAMIEKNILETAGFSVVVAHDGEEALKISEQEHFDMLITDVLMPKVDGFELIEQLKQNQKYKNLPVIVVTSRKSDEDRRRGEEVGASAYILKSDFTSDYLLECIEKLI